MDGSQHEDFEDTDRKMPLELASGRSAERAPASRNVQQFTREEAGRESPPRLVDSGAQSGPGARSAPTGDGSADLG